MVSRLGMPIKGTSLLASRKVVWGDPCTKGSGTAKVGTEEYEPHMRLYSVGKVTQHADAYNQQRYIVDVAGIGRKNMLLPGEVLD